MPPMLSAVEKGVVVEVEDSGGGTDEKAALILLLLSGSSLMVLRTGSGLWFSCGESPDGSGVVPTELSKRREEPGELTLEVEEPRWVLGRLLLKLPFFTLLAVLPFGKA